MRVPELLDPMSFVTTSKRAARFYTDAPAGNKGLAWPAGGIWNPADAMRGTGFFTIVALTVWCEVRALQWIVESTGLL
jgi:hypothetical protein